MLGKRHLPAGPRGLLESWNIFSVQSPHFPTKLAAYSSELLMLYHVG